MNQRQSKRIVGAVPVLVMPFDADGAIDEDSLRREIDFCVEARAQAIAFGIGSESGMLTDAERTQVWTLAARHLDGRLPLVAATSHESREVTIELTRLARECGADCAMVNPSPRQGAQLVSLFRNLSDRVDLALMIQDVGQNASADILLQAAQEASQVVSLKIESPAAPHKIGQIVSGLRQSGLTGDGDREVTVLGGANGNYLPEEQERGSVGTIPFPAIIDAYQTVCEQYAAGEAASGWKTYIRFILPTLRATSAGSGAGNAAIWLHKAILQRAGILRTAYCRMDISPLPDWIMDGVWKHLREANLCISRCLR
ncbi:MAG: dihydrodipicolinate synthase family protein [Candidatus Poribacteria bacterium]|nr:dihydrodipicolinate synthase family protein [Candidatus Poribacteria bacterium]